MHSMQLWHDRPKVTPEIRRSLMRHIHERKERQKLEAEQSAALKQQRLERAQKLQRDRQTLEQTKIELDRLRPQLVTLQNERHDLFAQLKKVLSDADEKRKRQEYVRQQQQRDEKEILSRVGPPTPLRLPSALRSLSTSTTTPVSPLVPPPPPPPPIRGQFQHANTTAGLSPQMPIPNMQNTAAKQPSTSIKRPLPASPSSSPSKTYAASPAKQASVSYSPTSTLPPPPPPPRLQPIPTTVPFGARPLNSPAAPGYHHNSSNMFNPPHALTLQQQQAQLAARQQLLQSTNQHTRFF